MTQSGRICSLRGSGQHVLLGFPWLMNLSRAGTTGILGDSSSDNSGIWAGRRAGGWLPSLTHVRITWGNFLEIRDSWTPPQTHRISGIGPRTAHFPKAPLGLLHPSDLWKSLDERAAELVWGPLLLTRGKGLTLKGSLGSQGIQEELLGCGVGAPYH